MLRINIILLLSFFISFEVKSQNDENPFAIYSNVGYHITDFTENTPTTLYGDIGVKYNFIAGLSAYMGLTYTWFHRPYDVNNGYLRRYNTEMIGIDIGGIYEFELDGGWRPGIGAAMNFNKFKTSSTKASRITGLDSTSTTLIWPISKPIYNYKGMVQIRKNLGDVIDMQLGFCYNFLESYYADDYAPTPKLDKYYTIYFGLLYKVGSSPGLKEAKAPKRKRRFSKKISCPTF